MRPFASGTGTERGTPALHRVPVRPGRTGRVRHVIPGAIGALALILTIGPFAVDSIRSASDPSASGNAGTIAALQRRVAAAPSDVAARLELAFAYRQAGDL